MTRVRNLFRRLLAAPQQRRRTERGMTLLEVMVVIAIIGLIATIVAPAVLERYRDAQRKTAGIQIKQIGEALEMYKLSMRHYPSSLSELVSPSGNQGQFMKTLPKDPWDKDYVYINPGSHNQGSFDLMSNGPDELGGTADDVGNWAAPTEAAQ